VHDRTNNLAPEPPAAKWFTADEALRPVSSLAVGSERFTDADVRALEEWGTGIRVSGAMLDLVLLGEVVVSVARGGANDGELLFARASPAHRAQWSAMVARRT
jgi:hypothetical protein